MPSGLPFDLGTTLGTPLAASPVAAKVRDLALDATSGDLALASGDLVAVGGLDSISSDCSATLQTILGEWFLDTTIGVDWPGKVWTKAPSLDLVRAVIRDALLGVLGVVEVVSVSIDLDAVSRTLTASWSVRSDLGVLDGTTSVGG